MTLGWLLENVKGAEYIVIESKEKELNPFTNGKSMKDGVKFVNMKRIGDK